MDPGIKLSPGIDSVNSKNSIAIHNLHIMMILTKMLNFKISHYMVNETYKISVAVWECSSSNTFKNFARC